MIAVLLLAAFGCWLYVAPSRRHANPVNRRSLLAWTRELLRQPRHGAGHPVWTAFGLCACLSVFLPALTLLLVRIASAEAARWLLLPCAVGLVLGAAANALLTVLARSTFGFGPGQPADATPAAKVTPVFLIAAAIAAATGAASEAVVSWFRA